ncbi:MAG TPA: DUF1684 domain-containing protein [Candidatus Limnocylindria bacterium]|nr:DUF1684 domain-containing protein [Candidatus Limnocylindria bacterium]
MDDGFLALADWRRRVAEIYATWRHESIADARAAWLTWRAARDELFRDHPQSPLTADATARFGGLSYFDYDPAFRLTASYEPADPTDDPHSPDSLPGGLLQLPTSGSEPFSFRRIGMVRLTGPLEGATLPVFWMSGYAGGVFLPFRDATSGSTTYGAGRYLLDTVKGADQGSNWRSGEMTLDFNLAYHPSCTYDPKWNCPLAPRDAWLTLPVKAGERLDESH